MLIIDWTVNILPFPFKGESTSYMRNTTIDIMFETLPTDALWPLEKNDIQHSLQPRNNKIICLQNTDSRHP